MNTRSRGNSIDVRFCIQRTGFAVSVRVVSLCSLMLFWIVNVGGMADGGMGADDRVFGLGNRNTLSSAEEIKLLPFPHNALTLTLFEKQPQLAVWVGETQKKSLTRVIFHKRIRQLLSFMLQSLGGLGTQSPAHYIWENRSQLPMKSRISLIEIIYNRSFFFDITWVRSDFLWSKLCHVMVE